MKRILSLLWVSYLWLASLDLQAQSIHLAPYYGNKQAALSLTFDDGLKEQYTLLFPKLKELGIKATFCVIGSRMEQQPKNPDKQTFSWQEAKEMIANGQEITSHGWAHRNVTNLTADELRYEVQHNDTIIYQRTGYFPRTYFYPGNRKNETAVAFCSKERVGTRTSQVSLGSKRSESWFEAWLNGIITSGEWGVTMTHGIQTGYDNFGDATRLWRMLRYALAQKEQLWIATFHDVAAYRQEVKHTSLRIRQHKSLTTIDVCSALSPSLFCMPLTMVLDFEPESVNQDGKPLAVSHSKGSWTFDFLPLRGKISIHQKGENDNH